MKGKAIRLSAGRRFIVDLLDAASSVPSVPVQRRMDLAEVVQARAGHPSRPLWTAIFAKAYAMVADELPELRRAYVKLPWHQIYEYPTSVASIAVEREIDGEKVVLIERVKDPAKYGLVGLSEVLRQFRTRPIDESKQFQRALLVSRLPRPIRRLLWWLGLNVGRQRGNYFGTFGVSVYSALGAESLHPRSTSTTTLTYGVMGDDGRLDVRLIYDHRVLDGASIARALRRLEEVLRGPIVAELRTCEERRSA